jgi:hypothetical protein
VVSDLAGATDWFGGVDRSEEETWRVHGFLHRGCQRIRLAMDMWREVPQGDDRQFPRQRFSTQVSCAAPLNNAMDRVRKAEYKRLTNRADRKYIKGQKYVLLSHRENLSPEKRQRLKTLLAANKRLNTAYVLKEQFGQLWSYRREAWARRFFEQWRDALKWQRLKPFEDFAR